MKTRTYLTCTVARTEKPIDLGGRYIAMFEGEEKLSGETAAEAVELLRAHRHFGAADVLAKTLQLIRITHHLGGRS